MDGSPDPIRTNCAELARKLAPSNLPEIRDRALKALSSKVEGNLLPGEVALETPGLPQLILHWLNDRQAAVPPSAIATAFRLLGALAHAGPAAVRLQEAGCVPFLQDFRPQAPPECLKDLDAALWALLTHQRPTRPSDSAEEDLEAKYIGEKTLRPSSVTPRAREAPAIFAKDNAALTPPKVPLVRTPPALKIALPESPELCEADQQLLLDMAVRLKFSEGPHRCAAFLELLELAAEVPPKMILAYAPLVEAICLGIRDQAAATKASEVLCLLLERLGELSVPAVAGYGPPQRPRNLGEDTPALWHFLAQLLATGLACPFARHATSRSLALLGLEGPPEPGTKPDELLVGALHTALAAVGLVEKDVVALLFDSGLMVEYPKVSAALEVVAEEVACRLFQAHSEPQSAVYARVVRDFAAAQGPAELRRAVAPLLVSWPQSSQGLLTLPGYLPQILGALAPAMWMPREGSVDASHGPVVRFPDKEQMELLEHVYDVLRLTPAEEGSPGFRELGELFGRRLMPALWALLGQPASPAKVREAHGLLAADASLNRATELILRCSAALATNSEAKKALGPWQDWQPLVTALVTAVTPPPRLALHVAIRLGAAKTGNDEAFAEALLESFSTPADSSSIRHSEALRAALWLAADFCSAEASAYVTPWLTHADAVVAAAAWRSLRCLLFARSEDADAEIQTARSAAAARAARALRGWARRWEMEEDSFLLPVAEALELIRWFLEASKEADSAEAARQVLDSGLVELNGVVANCLAARQLHLGVRRTAVRLLQALLAADFAAVGPKLFKVGFWSLAVSAAAPVYECTVLQTEAEHGQILDAASLAAEVMILVRQGSQSDPQLLLWLSAATPLLDSWKRALRGLGLSLASSTGSSLHLRQRALRLADAHLACLCHVMGHVEQAPSDFSWTSTDGWGPLHEVLVTEEVAFLLLETLKAEMPIATVALSTWSLLRCRGLGQDVAAAAAADKDLGTVAARRSIAVLSTLGTGRAQAPGASTAQCLCLANLASASPEAATSAAEGAPELAAQAARLAALGRHQQQVLWILRAFFAILASSQDALEGALELSNTTVLSTMILGVRAAADRDETICLELFEQLLQLFARTEISEPVAAELLRAEILPWLMRFSLKRSCACAAFCRVMDILAFCSSVLAGKPLLLRFLGQLIEAVRGQCKIPASDLWRNRRLTSAMNFIASLRLCPRSTALVAKGNAPDAGTRRPISTPAAAGLDLWFDLVEGSLPGGAPRSVRSAALRVLLAVASSDSPHAKAGIDAWPRLAQWLRGTRSAAECRRMTPREGILHRMAEEVGSDSTQPMLSAYPS